ncbi:hypothetical protein PP707_00690 [Acetobacter pasteurianus]|nr:hypothetical protein [Acetobacter pasteurianus]
MSVFNPAAAAEARLLYFQFIDQCIRIYLTFSRATFKNRTKRNQYRTEIEEKTTYQGIQH